MVVGAREFAKYLQTDWSSAWSPNPAAALPEDPVGAEVLTPALPAEKESRTK